MNSEQPPNLSGYNLWELMAKEVRRPGEKEEAAEPHKLTRVAVNLQI